MELFHAMSTRRSARKFKSDPVPNDDIRTMIDFAAKAPSASNMQMWKFVAVSNRRVLSEMKEAILAELDLLSRMPESEEYRGRLQAAMGYSTFFAEAPVTIVVLVEPYSGHMDQLLSKRGLKEEEISKLRQRPDLQSIGAAIENFCLAAHSMGYGTCWMTAPCIAGPKIKEILSIEDRFDVVALLPLGVPDESPSARPRKPLEEILEFIS